ncbi:MAG TPA: NosD domain-containing protein, partial [Anaerolineales bacterium]|nr:NosD domain-containing protein [Anaerolineales bacterium]
DGSSITIPEFVHGIVISSDHNILRGLQIVGFSDAGVALSPGSQHNLIGGDRNIGDGPLGQGNLISGNHYGLGMWEEATSHNTIQGNYIGITVDGTAAWGNDQDGIHSVGARQNLITDNVIGGNETGIYLSWVMDGGNTVTGNLIGVGPDGNPLANTTGIIIDHTSHNIVGPGNTIAYNRGDGISFWEETSNNTVTRNSIHDNRGRGILITSPSQSTLQPPRILSFDLKTGTVSGTACPNCIIEIFSDGGDQGAIFEGSIIADRNGAFAFMKAASLAGPFLTATATDPDGNTSEFSLPARGSP